MARPTRTRKSSRPARSAGGAVRHFLGRLLLALVILGGLAALLVTTYLDQEVRERFEGARWSLPAKVHGRALELFPGRPLSAGAFEAELERLGYRRVASPDAPGTYARAGKRFEVHRRPAVFADGPAPGRRFSLAFADGRIERLSTGQGGSVARLEPPLIGSFYPAHNEDRVLIRLEDTPERLVETLLAVEDRSYFDHWGVRPLAILRALAVNLRAGETVQGGSTITQQLVKNFFLSNERTLERKGIELVMALILEWRFDKREILEAYLNEVYLGQQGRRAIHGFGLAARYYFNRPLGELSTDQIALLVGMVKGPSYYNPRRHPERARERRDLVLDILAGQGVISTARGRQLKARALGVTASPPPAGGRYAGYLDLVREQLARDYSEADLRSQGLQIFTTLDPAIQETAEATLARRLDGLEQDRGLPGESLQGAVVVTHAGSGEVLAMVGDRRAGRRGFNRALNARRPVGSLVKPFIYLAALEDDPGLALTTPISDAPLRLTLDDGDVWSPQNYDRRHHGEVTVVDALAHSYNVATARLGLRLGTGAVVDALQRAGIHRPLPDNPAMLLGSVELTPIEVTRAYQTLAAGGFDTPLRSIRAVLDADHRRLKRYPLRVRQAFDERAVYLVQAAMREVVRRGTAERLQPMLPRGLVVAGKTGTTDDLRDSWFAGFTGERLAVVWVGRDDNRPAGLTGSSGAMRVWGDLFARHPGRNILPPEPEGLAWHWVDPATGGLSAEDCEGSALLPFRAGNAPDHRAPCRGRAGVPAPLRWLQDLLGGED